MHFRNEIITNPMQNLRMSVAKSIQTLYEIYAFPHRSHYKPYAKEYAFSIGFRSGIITNSMQNLCMFAAKLLQTLYKPYVFSK